MSLIRLECTHESEAAEFQNALEPLRDRFVERHGFDRGDDSLLRERIWPELHFSCFPEQLLLAYEKHREASELGLVFRIANGLHDHLDAMVIHGASGPWHAVRSIIEICCDPFHNELTRAARGSKPRVYFSPLIADNDHFRSLLERLDAGGHGDVPAERRWGLIASGCDAEIGPHRQRAFDLMLDELVRRIDRIGDEALREQLVTSVGPKQNVTSARLAGAGFGQHLFVPSFENNAFAVLSPAGLLPFAFLGFDCVQLLVGAAEINRNLAEADFGENLVLKQVAANLAAKSHDVSQTSRPPAFSSPPRSMPDRAEVFLSESLTRCNRLAEWLSALSAGPCFAASPRQDGPERPGAGIRPLQDSDLRHFLARDPQPEGTSSSLPGLFCGKPLVQHLDVAQVRTDPFPIPEKLIPSKPTPASGSEPKTGTAEPSATGATGWALADHSTSLAELRRDDEQGLYDRLADRNVRQIRATLPVIDMNSIGQWLQLMMLSAELESHFHHGTDP